MLGNIRDRVPQVQILGDMSPCPIGIDAPNDERHNIVVGHFSVGMPLRTSSGVGCDGMKGGGIGPHNCIQPRAPKNFNPALLIGVDMYSFSDTPFNHTFVYFQCNFQQLDYRYSN